VIRLVTGPPGNGKSFYAVRATANALMEKKVVATNVELRDDWVEYIANRDPFLITNRYARRKWFREAPGRYHYTDDLEELFSIRLRGNREGRGLAVLDEAHNWMNARSWSAEDRKQIVRWFSQHRKLGFDVVLIAQDQAMLDKQVRDLFEYHVAVRNLRKARMMGVPIVPCNMFLAVWQWHAATRVIVKREVFRLSWRKNLYNTMALSHGLDGQEDDDTTLWLPALPPDARAPDGRTDASASESAARPPAARPPAASADSPRVVSPVLVDPTGSELGGDAYDAASLDPTGGE
jgi:RecA/RadA recombinase